MVASTLNEKLGWRPLLIIFLSFIVVTSDLFTSSVTSGFSGAVFGTRVTSKGAMLQGIMQVIIFALSIYLIDVGVI